MNDLYSRLLLLSLEGCAACADLTRLYYENEIFRMKDFYRREAFIDRQHCCDVRYNGEEKYLRMKEQVLRDQMACEQKVIQANACCCYAR